MERFYEGIYFLVTRHYNYEQWAYDYIDFIFPHVFIVGILVVPTVISAIFYNVINNITGRLGYAKFWYIFMSITALVSFFVGFNRTTRVIYYGGVEIGTEAWILGFMTAIYAVIFYFLISLVLKIKKITTYADHIPFNTKW